MKRMFISALVCIALLFALSLPCDAATNTLVFNWGQTISADFGGWKLYKSTSIAPKAGELGTIIRSYKSSVTRKCNENNIPLAWQSRFYDHIIRSEKETERIRRYIEGNPAKWHEDRERPINLWM